MTPARTPRRKRRKLWAHTAGQHPASVRVEEREPAGLLYCRVWDPTVRRQRRRSLGHRDREQAIAFAEREAKKLRDGLAAVAPQPTVGYVLEQYLAHRTPTKGKGTQLEDRRRALMWLRILGTGRRVSSIGSPEWETFKAQRLTGAIDAHGRPIVEKDRGPVTPRTVDADLTFLISVWNWACSWKVQGRPLLDFNPWGTLPGVRRSLERPKTLAPMRPIATHDRYLALRTAAERVHMKCGKDTPGAELVIVGHGARTDEGKRTRGGTTRLWMRPSYLGEILDLLEATGRRIGAVLALTYSDIVREGGAPVALRWRPFKGSRQQIIPVSAAARETLERILTDREGLGDLPLFPSYADPSKPITRAVARGWLLDAEEIAQLPHLEGGAFHPFRRAWASSRKHLPDVDVATVGGWRSIEVLKQSYQLSDSATVLEVVNSPAKLRDRTAGEATG